jgi:curved DNA-binding protein CbpA
MSDRFDINHVYDILGLKPGASVDEVKQAYRQMAKTWHPDYFLEPHQKLEAEEKIKEINQAYARLKSYQPNEMDQFNAVLQLQQLLGDPQFGRSRSRVLTNFLFLSNNWFFCQDF